MVLAALACNAALLVLTAFVGEARDVLYVLVFAVPPLPLLALGKHPPWFRAGAGLLGAAYIAWNALTFFIGGVLLAPSGLLLLAAALCPAPGHDGAG